MTDVPNKPTTRIARKAHQCDYCGSWIAVGAEYLDFGGTCWCRPHEPKGGPNLDRTRETLAVDAAWTSFTAGLLPRHKAMKQVGIVTKEVKND